MEHEDPPQTPATALDRNPARPSGKHRLRRWFWALAPVALYALLIFLLSAQSELPDSGFLSAIRKLFHRSPAGRLFGFDKIQHFLEYAAFGFLIARALQVLARAGSSPWRRILIATMLGAAFGATDEIHQYFVPNRDSSVFDLIADTLGTAVGALSWHVLATTLRRTLRSGAEVAASGRASS